MTPHEIVAANEVSNRQLLESRNLPVSEAMLDLLGQASINGFTLGARVATSAMEAAVMMVKLKK